MENFVVSARKYRPTGFDEVVGQEHITTTLKNAIENNKLAQALLFCGPRGVGKTTCARIVARLINGFEEKSETNSLNIFELDAASNNSVEDIRNLIDQVRVRHSSDRFEILPQPGKPFTVRGNTYQPIHRHNKLTALRR